MATSFFFLYRNGVVLTSETFVTWWQIPTGSPGPISVVLVASVTPVYLGHPVDVTRMTTPWGSVCPVVTLRKLVPIKCLQQVACTSVCTHAMEITNRRPLST